MKKLRTYFCFIAIVCLLNSSSVNAEDVIEVTEEVIDQNDVEICNYEDDLKILAQLIEAEAGNQGLYGKRLVADVVLNRVDSPLFPNTIKDVIFQPYHFQVVWNGMFDSAASRISSESYEAARIEMVSRTDYKILFFSQEKSIYAQNHYKYRDHWFGY